MLFVLGVSFYEHLKRARRGVPGSKGLVVGFLLFILLAGEEVLVTAGVINFLFLADVGFLCVVVPVGIQLGRRFIDDAHRLRELSFSLASEVKQRTSERDAAREALLEQERLAALGRLAAGVGHEINNPLQYLFLSLDALRDATHPSTTAESESIHYALDAAERIRRVVEGLRVYSRGNADRYAVVRLADVVEHAMRVAAPQIRTGAQVVTELDAAPDVLGDEARLVQVVVNPLVNAAQSLMSAGVAAPTIHIRTGTSESGDAQIEIRDNGPGFALEILPKLGTPYVTTKTGIGGTGLGLFVSRGIVEAHGGSMVLENAPEGGALVRILLPRVHEAVGAQRLTPAAVVDTPRTAVVARHVIVVDDDEAVRLVLQRGLTRRGYRVTTASDGEDALQLLQQQEVDVVVSDVMMPRMSGIEFAEALEQTYPALRRRFIVMTGGAVSPAAEAFMQRDDLTLCEKPVSLDRLCQEIEALSINTRRVPASALRGLP
jgi:signal transduction histidine kinase/ActR/RegA family two-component response regulator